MTENNTEETITTQDEPVELTAKQGIENLESFGDVALDVSVVLGTVTMPIGQFLKLGRGAIIELSQNKDAYTVIRINGHPLAMGEIIVVNENVGVTVMEQIKKSILDV